MVRHTCPDCLRRSVARVSPDFTGRKPRGAVEDIDGHYEVTLKVCDGFTPHPRVVDNAEQEIIEAEAQLSTGEISQERLERIYERVIRRITPQDPHTWEDRRFICNDAYYERKRAENTDVVRDHSPAADHARRKRMGRANHYRTRFNRRVPPHEEDEDSEGGVE